MTIRRLLLAIHLYVGLAAALVLLVASATGAVLAFEPDWDRWLHPALWRAGVGAPMHEDALVALVRRATGDTAAVRAIDFGGPGRAQKFTLADDRELFVDPATGAVLGARDARTRLAAFLFGVRRLHVQLFANQAGEWVVDIATAAILLLVPTGVLLWWRTKRAKVRWSGSWWRLTYDLHAVFGIFGSAFVLVLAVTGFFMAFEPALHVVTGTKPEPALNPPHSVVPANAGAAPRASLDSLLVAADRALPGERTRQLIFRESPRSAVSAIKAGRGGVGSSVVYLDAYTGAVLRADDFVNASGAERAHALNQQLHFGTIFGFPQRALTSLASAVTALLTLTGVLFWGRRLVRK